MSSLNVNKVFKKFRIGFKKRQSALARFISLFSGREPKKEIMALKGVSFSCKPGEILGIIGKNGSGKSTLLRCISGIYSIDSGGIEARGNVISIIGLGVGFQERLSMRDNIYLVGSLFGASRKGINCRYNEILEFSELEEFENTKLYQFSSGMLQRLAFSIAIYCNPEILILDEVFEVGDERFKEKSAKKLLEIARGGGIILFVSHDLEMAKKYCTRAILLDSGKIAKAGKTAEAIREYLNL